jgi:hypothetical protein
MIVIHTKADRENVDVDDWLQSAWVKSPFTNGSD